MVKSCERWSKSSEKGATVIKSNVGKSCHNMIFGSNIYLDAKLIIKFIIQYI